MVLEVLTQQIEQEISTKGMVEANECEETEVSKEPHHPSSITKEPHHHASDSHGTCWPRCNDDCEPTQKQQEEGTVATVPCTVGGGAGEGRVDLSDQTKHDATTATDENNNAGTTVSGTAPSPSRYDQTVHEAKRPPPENPTAAIPPSGMGSLYPSITLGENLYPQIFNDATRAHDRLVLLGNSRSDSVVTTKQEEEQERKRRQEEDSGEHVVAKDQISARQIAEASQGIEEGGAGADAGNTRSDAAHSTGRADRSISIRSWPSASFRGSVSGSRRKGRWQSEYNCDGEEEEKVDEDELLRRELAAKERARAKRERGMAGIGSIIASNKPRKKRAERPHPMMTAAYDSSSSSSLVGSMKSVDDKLEGRLSHNMGSIVGHGAFRIGGDDSIEPTHLAHQTAIRVPPPILDVTNTPEGGMCEAGAGLTSSGSSSVGLAVGAGAGQDDDDDDDVVVEEAEVVALPTATAWPVDNDVEVGVAIDADEADGNHGDDPMSRVSNGRRGSVGATYATTKNEDGVDVCLIHLPKRALLIVVCSLLVSAAIIGVVLATRKTPASITTDDEIEVSEQGITSEDSLPTLDSSALLVCPSTKLHPKIGRNGDHFGYAIDGKGDTVLIGAHFSNSLGENSGAAYIFRRNQQDNTWFEEAKIYPDDGIAGDKFGVKVALGRSGNLAIISADQVGFGKGAVYIYERVDQETKNTTMPWTLQAKLMAEDATEGSQFGDSIAIYDETIAIGASHPDVLITGAVYIFEKDRDSSAWVQVNKLVPNDISTNPYATESRFGRSVALASDILVVGADKDSPSGRFSGSAYIYLKEIGPNGGKYSTWLQEAKIYPSDGGESQYFGHDVDIDNIGNTVVISSWKDGEITKPATEEKAAKTEQMGSVYIFNLDDSTGNWTQQAKITAEDGEPGDRFGNSISINGDGDSLLVGAYHDDERRGSAYLFRQNKKDGPSWTQTMKLRAGDVNAVEEFANQVVLDGNRAFIGENKDGDNSDGYEAGAAHVYEMDNCYDG